MNFLSTLQNNLPILTFLVGLVPSVLFYRWKMRSVKNGYHLREFNDLQLVIEKSSKQLSDLAERVGELEQIRTDLIREIGELKRENERLNELLKQLPIQHEHRTVTEEHPAPEKTGRRTKQPRK